ncbi:unnamed protein product [Brassicogethes aeneus]|uniref:Cuticle protein n=1 Tax=Brassicogethes aeneus TaxID=1431903 RepID=A0A9P0B0N3_BRAAE|nr:unnamed protein product [Brassicogethes aeneus]
MAFKFVVFAAFVAVARAGAIGYAAAPVAYSAAPAVATSYSSIAHSAPVVAKYAAAPVYTQSYAAPAYSHGYAAPAVAAYAPVHKTIIAEPEAPAHYDFGYSVNDPHTGDSKSQQESRQGDVVHGSYSLIDADGTKRTVEYTADDHNGFNAVVHKEPAQVAVKAIQKVAVAAPVAYAAPVAHYSAAPVVAKYAAAPALSYYH